jgi:hypothetical protein
VVHTGSPRDNDYWSQEMQKAGQGNYQITLMALPKWHGVRTLPLELQHEPAEISPPLISSDALAEEKTRV